MHTVFRLSSGADGLDSSLAAAEEGERLDEWPRTGGEGPLSATAGGHHQGAQ